MATYTLQRIASGFIPVSPGFNDTGVFSIGFPISTDSNMPQPYQPAVGDIIKLGWLPKGFLLYQGWFDAAMSGVGTSSWFFDVTATDSPLGDIVDNVTVAGMSSRYYFLIGKPAVFFGNEAIPGLTTQAQLTMTCNAITGSGNLSGSVALRGTMDFQNATLSPITGEPQI